MNISDLKYEVLIGCLEWYANKSNYEEGAPDNGLDGSRQIEIDGGIRARNMLKILGAPLANPAKPTVYVRCSACGVVMFAIEEVKDDVCPKCGHAGCMGERFTRDSLPIFVSLEELPELAISVEAEDGT